jgi:hypothetical protein
MIYEVEQMFYDVVNESDGRVRIESQPEGWAVIIDNEVYTWAKTKDRACDVALRLVDAGVE